MRDGGGRAAIFTQPLDVSWKEKKAGERRKRD
jgi:hypothetical protein